MQLYPPLRKVSPHTPSVSARLPDFRWRLTRKVRRVLEEDRHVVVIGGPKIGKTYLAQQIKQTKKAVPIFDDVRGERIEHLLNAPAPILITTDISFLEESRALGDEIFRVPLTTIPPKHLQSVIASDWNISRGHPALISSSPQKSKGPLCTKLCRQWQVLLKLNPMAQQAYREIMGLPAELTPVQRYRTIRYRFGPQTKQILDWLVCLGFLHRQKYTGGSAGIIPVLRV